MPGKPSLSCKREEVLLRAIHLKPTSFRNKVQRQSQIQRRVHHKEGRGPKVLQKCRLLFNSLKCIFRSALHSKDPNKTKSKPSGNRGRTWRREANSTTKILKIFMSVFNRKNFMKMRKIYKLKRLY